MSTLLRNEGSLSLEEGAAQLRVKQLQRVASYGKARAYLATIEDSASRNDADLIELVEAGAQVSKAVAVAVVSNRIR